METVFVCYRNGREPHGRAGLLNQRLRPGKETGAYLFSHTRPFTYKVLCVVGDLNLVEYK